MKDHDIAQGLSLKLSEAEYHKRPEISKSGLDKINKSPAHFMESLRNPPEQTDAMALGSLVHKAILEPSEFMKNCLVVPQFEGPTKDGRMSSRSAAAKEAKQQWYAELKPDQMVITGEEFVQIKGMLDSVYAHPSAGQLLQKTHNELSFFWHDIESGADCRCRPDALREGHIIIDLKTTHDASPKAFQRSLAQFRYHVQAAFYLEGLSQVTSQNYDTFVLVAVETKPPYAVAVYVLDSATIEAGQFQYKKDLRKYANCMREGKWPAYSDEIMPMNLPAYAWPVEE